MSSTDSDISIDSGKIPRTADTSPATWFDYSEVPDRYWDSPTDWYRTKKEDYFKHLAALNQGKKVVAGRYNTQYETYMMNRDLINSLGSQLGLTQSQRSTARKRFLQLSLDEWGVRAEHVAYAICQFTVHSDEEDERQCHPYCNVEDVPPEFKRVRNSVKLPSGEMGSLYAKIQKQFQKESILEPQSHDEYGIGSLHQNRLDQ